MYKTLEERTLDAIKEKNIKWLILEDITNDQFGNDYEYWVCAESIDFSRKHEDWHSAIYIDNQDAIKVVCAALSAYSRVCLLLDGEQIK
jgi:hypothetical protein